MPAHSRPRGGPHGPDHGVRVALEDHRAWPSAWICHFAHAVAAYYRSLFLNVTIPGGIVGDVHRGVSHGRDVGDVARALRAVAWDRTAGQAVQALITVGILLVLLFACAIGDAARDDRARRRACRCRVPDAAMPAGDRSRPARCRAVARDIRLAARAKIVDRYRARLCAVVGGHAVTFLIAARTAGTRRRHRGCCRLRCSWRWSRRSRAWVSGDRVRVPRHGCSARPASAAGGITTGVVYAGMLLVASLPGAAVLGVAWFRRPRSLEPLEAPLPPAPAHA